MTHHVHLLVTPMHDYSVSRVMQYLGRLYVRYFNDSYARTGTLFEGRFRSSLVQEDEYLLACLFFDCDLTSDPAASEDIVDVAVKRTGNFTGGIHSRVSFA